jgi:hypothetical protein
MISLYENHKALTEEWNNPKITDIIPPEYHKFLPLFSEVEANKYPPRHPYDYCIPVKEDFILPFRPIYPLSQTELEGPWKWLNKNLSKGFIRISSSLASIPILFVKKSYGSL